MSTFPAEGHGALAPVPARRRRRRVDVAAAARLFAEGLSTGEVADRLGCSRQHVWRLVRHSRRLPRAIVEAEAQVGRDAETVLKGLRPSVARGIARELDERNVRVLLWCADRLGLAREAADTPPVAEEPKNMSMAQLWRMQIESQKEIQNRAFGGAVFGIPGDRASFEAAARRSPEDDDLEINDLDEDA